MTGARRFRNDGDNDRDDRFRRFHNRTFRNRRAPVMVLGAKRGAGRVTADRVIICEACVAADARVAVKLSIAAPIKKNIRFVFIDNLGFY